MEKINIEEVIGEPIDEKDLIFKLSNSGKKPRMLFVSDMIYDYYCMRAAIDKEYVNSDEIITRIANDIHEGKLNEERIRKEMLAKQEVII